MVTREREEEEEEEEEEETQVVAYSSPQFFGSTLSFGGCLYVCLLAIYGQYCRELPARIEHVSQ